MSVFRSAFLSAYEFGYQHVARPRVFRSSAAQAHEQALDTLAWLDEHSWMHGLLRGAQRLAFPKLPREVGGVALPHPLILAAGMVKGLGYHTEDEACDGAQSTDIIPGWRSLPLLDGPVEFGSFTRWPRLGNPGEVVWRDEASQSTRNRVGLKNPGARAAARFLADRCIDLPPIFGLNVAPSPGVDDPAQMVSEIVEAIGAFVALGIRPSWWTLNVSCPNTEDDPALRQTELTARALMTAAIDALSSTGAPLWVKLGPDLADEQYRVLLALAAETGVRAVVATNTLPRPAPSDTSLTAGVGGGALRDHALAAVRVLAAEKARAGGAVDIIGCGGALNGASLRALLDAGASAVQYWSALVYRGPLAAALMLREAAIGDNTR